MPYLTVHSNGNNAILTYAIINYLVSDTTMVSRSKLWRSSAVNNGLDHHKAYENSLSHELSDVVFVTPRMKKFLELKGVQYRVRSSLYICQSLS